VHSPYTFTAYAHIASDRPAGKIAFVSPHCLVDFSSGAATATRDALKLLATQGFQCMAYCGTRLDQPGEGLIQEQLFRRGIEYEVRKARIPYSSATHLDPNSSGADADALLEGKTGYDARLIFLTDGNLPVTLFENGSTRGGWFGADEVGAFLTACDVFMYNPAPLSRHTSRSSIRWGLRAYTSLRRSPTRWRGAGRTYPSLSRKAAVTPKH
jgi:hypothetical protein